jgi:hypothetical protein
MWTRERKRKPYRRRRLRRAHFGELLQLDGSFHAWLEGRGPTGCLLNLVDDATGMALAVFAKDETTWAVAGLVRAWVERYGVPRAIYTDWKSVYHAPPEKEEVAPQLSQFGNMCAKLGIRLIAANSPQAKGRVERHHGTHQDRLVKKMRRLGIADYVVANRYLAENYLPAHNARFGVPPADPVDLHQSLPRKLDLNTVFCLEHRRTVGNDWVVRFEPLIADCTGSNCGRPDCEDSAASGWQFASVAQRPPTALAAYYRAPSETCCYRSSLPPSWPHHPTFFTPVEARTHGSRWVSTQLSRARRSNAALALQPPPGYQQCIILKGTFLSRRSRGQF